MELKGGQCLCHKGLFILWTLGSLLTIPFIDNLYSSNCLLHLKVLLSSWTTSISNPLGFTLLSLYSTLMTSMSLLHLCARRRLHSSLLVSQKKKGGGYPFLCTAPFFQPVLLSPSSPCIFESLPINCPLSLFFFQVNTLVWTLCYVPSPFIYSICHAHYQNPHYALGPQKMNKQQLQSSRSSAQQRKET